MREFAISEFKEEFELVSLLLSPPYICLLERPQFQTTAGLNFGRLATWGSEGDDGAMVKLSEVGLRQPTEMKDLDHPTEVTASAEEELKELTETTVSVRPYCSLLLRR